jgi:hypothetical protein
LQPLVKDVVDMYQFAKQATVVLPRLFVMSDRSATRLEDFSQRKYRIIDQIMYLDLCKSFNVFIMNDFSFYRRLRNTIHQEVPSIENEAWFMVRQIFQMTKWIKTTIVELSQKHDQVVSCMFDLANSICDKIESGNGSDQLLRAYLFSLCLFDGMIEGASSKQTAVMLKRLHEILELEKKNRNVLENDVKLLKVPLKVLETEMSFDLSVKLYMEKCAAGTFSVLKEKGICCIL